MILAKKKQAFWKKLGPEIERTTRHIGNIIDKSNVAQIVDALIYGGVAIQGALVMNDPRGALIGPIGLKLAQSPNLIAGGAGIAVLAALGLASIAPSAIDDIRNKYEETTGLKYPPKYIQIG